MNSTQFDPVEYSDDIYAHPIQPRIINGSTATAGQFPWQAAILYNPQAVYDTQYCGGTIIGDTWILTAAHCFDSTAEVFVGVGYSSLNESPGSAILEVAGWYIHPDYDDESFNNDIAIIELSSAIDFTACGANCSALDRVTSSNEAALASTGTAAQISGWGKTVGGLEPPPNNYPVDLLYASVNLVGCLDSPSLYLSASISDNMICANDALFSKDSCQGDSGGPLVVNNADDSGYLLAGVISWGNGCAVENYPGVYTRVANYEEWIEQVVSGVIGAGSRVNFTGTSTSSGSDDSGGGSFGPLLILLLLSNAFQKDLRHSQCMNHKSNHTLKKKELRIDRLRPKHLLIAIPFTLLFTSGCIQSSVTAGQSAKSSTAVAAETDLYQHWQLQRIDRGEQSTTLDTHETQFSMRLTQEGKETLVNGYNACNHWRGRATVGDATVGKSLKIESAGMTRKRCNISDPLLNQMQSKFLPRLRIVNHYHIEKGLLYLTAESHPDSEIWVFTIRND